jgi:hypothetical protein
MERIQNFKSFSTLRTQLREEAENQQREVSRGEAAASFNELLKKYNVTRASELTEDQLEAFTAELFDLNEEEAGITEGRAFIFAASKAKKEGKKEFEWNGKKYPITLKESETEEAKETEEVNEGKRERNSVVNAWKKSGVKELNAIAKVYADAMEDANFHQEVVTSKVIGSASRAKDQGKAYSDIANAAKWDGYAIANGTVDYLKEIGEDDAADKLLNAITKFNLNESVNLNSLQQITERFRGDDLKKPAVGFIYNRKETKVQVVKMEDRAMWMSYPSLKDATDKEFNGMIGVSLLDTFKDKFDVEEVEIGGIYDVKESVNLNSLQQIIEEGTRGQFGKIYKSGEIASVYTHYDSYPEHMLPVIKKGYKSGSDVDAVISKGDNSGLEADINKIKFYNDKNSMTPLKGSVKNLKKYINDADANGAEYAYLYDERDGKWYMIDLYGDRELKPAFESVVTESKYDKKKLLKAIENSDDAMILVKGKEYIIYNPDNGNDDNTAMWGDKTIIALDQDGEEHEFKYSDIERFSESVVNEAEVDINDEIGGLIEDLYSKLNDLAEETTDTAWRKAIENIVKNVEKVETAMGAAARKLGVVPIHESEVICEATVEMDALDPDNKDFLKFLKKNKVEIINKMMSGPAGQHPVITMQGKRKDLETVLADCDYGWCDGDLAEYIEEGNAFGDAVRKAKEAGEEEFEFDGKTYKVEEAAKDEQKAMELYVSLVDLKKGKHSESELQSMSEDELFNLVQTEGGLKGAEAKNVAKELAKIAKG